VTPRSYNELEADGFGGLTDTRPATVARLAGELRRWRPDMGETNRDLVSVNHSVRTHGVELVSLVRRLGAQRPAAETASWPSPVEELARLLRLEWQMYDRMMRTTLEAKQLRTETDRHRASAEDAIARVALLDRELHRAGARVATLDEHLRRTDARVEELETLADEVSRELRGLRAMRRHRLAERLGATLDLLRRRL
jgi:chromosome segregation ATPase